MRGLKRTRPALAATSNGAGDIEGTRTRQVSKPQAKINRVFAALAAGHSFNRFEAVRELRDWCLNSTIAEIEDRKGIAVCRHWETVPGFQGSATRCCRYWLAPEQRQKALKLLGAVDVEEA